MMKNDEEEEEQQQRDEEVHELSNLSLIEKTVWTSL